MDQASPLAVARAARTLGVGSVAFTYNDPVIFAEYAIDIASECRFENIHTVAVTAGYIHPQPRSEFFAAMDAANVDLKGFTEQFYFRLCGAHLAPVLDTLVWLRHESDTWLEITTLLIPGANDSVPEIEAMCRWIVQELGTDVPLHFTAFYPDYRLTDRPATPLATLRQARQIARGQGLQHVYLGNVADSEGSRTDCPACGTPLIEREGYAILAYRLTPEACCPVCGTRICGHFGNGAGTFGNRRIPISLAGHT